MFHVVGEDDPPIGVLDLESDPPETSEEQELLPLSNDPDHAILNPESLASYAMGMDTLRFTYSHISR